MNGHLLPSEAAWLFTAYLTSQPKSLQVGAAHDCTIMAELCREFCNKYKLTEPRERWPELVESK